MKANHLFMLDDKRRIISTGDVYEWGRFMERRDRVVANTKVGEATISTVFLGLDHSFGDGPPLLWETMIFGGERDQYQDRCAGGWEQAEAMHAATYKMLTGSKYDESLNNGAKP